jgi:hypothetical protein
MTHLACGTPETGGRNDRPCRNRVAKLPNSFLHKHSWIVGGNANPKDQDAAKGI